MSKDVLMRQISDGVQELQDATDLVDELVSRRLRINRTDLRCLSRLSARGAMTASELASAAGITPGAGTTAIDRLERAGLVLRQRDLGDRRRVLVSLTEQAETASGAIWGPTVEEARDVMKGYSLAELRVISSFVAAAIGIQERFAVRLSPATSEPARVASAPDDRAPLKARAR